MPPQLGMHIGSFYAVYYRTDPEIINEDGTVVYETGHLSVIAGFPRYVSVTPWPPRFTDVDGDYYAGSDGSTGGVNGPRKLRPV